MKIAFNDVSRCFEFFNKLYGEKSDEQKARYKKAFAEYKRLYKNDEFYVASSSGRVEVIGNHTDHNGGVVISSAISLDTLCFFNKSNDNIINIYSEGYGIINIDLNKDEKVENGTTKSLVIGVVKYFYNKGYNVGGFNAYCTSNVIGGAGISSSASFEVLIAEVLNFLFNDDNISCEEKTNASWFAENEFFGKPCGKLDQTAICYGGLNILDFSNKDRIVVKKIKNRAKKFSFVLINTGGSHENLIDEYASIPKEMFSVARYFNKDRLIEIRESDFYNSLDKLNGVVSDRAISRAIHFYQENQRVLEAYKNLNKNKIDRFISCITMSGNSSLNKLQNCFVPKMLNNQPIVKTMSILSTLNYNFGYRIHGGGFAGSVLCVVKNSEIDKFLFKVKQLFGDENVVKVLPRESGTIVL